MRVTSSMIYEQLTKSFREHMKSLSVAYNMVSTGKKINRPSDDVVGMARAMDYKVSLGENEQYKRNIEEAYAHLSFAEGVMSSVSNVLTRARELAMEAANDTQNAQNRDAIAEEVADLRDHLLSLANSKFRDRYIFSGFKTDTESFNSSFTYKGDSKEIEVMVDRNATVAINIPGSTAFFVEGETFFKILDDLRIALENNDLSGIQSSLTDIDKAVTQTANVMADMGARLNYLDSQSTRLEDRNFSLKAALSTTEDADLAEAVREIAKTEAALQALRVSGSEVISRSLLDFLR